MKGGGNLMKYLTKLAILITIIALVSIPVTAQALEFGFTCITNNIPSQGDIGEAQLYVDVIDYNNGQVLFEFHNEGPDDATVKLVLFDDGDLLSIISLIDRDEGIGGDSGVDFTKIDENESPTLPGGQNIGFETTAGLGAEADPPPAHRGIDPGEFLGILFDLVPGATYDDVIADMQDGSSLRIGLHVISIGPTDGSESFVNNPDPNTPPAAIPEPSTILFFIACMIGMPVFKRQLSK